MICKSITSDTTNELEKIILAKAANALKSKPDRDIFDLHIFYAILCSTGTNKNTDHFDPIELWRARHSCSQKPVNIGHTQTRIIGHMLDSIVVGEDLKPIPENTSEGDLPYKFHLITSAVVYKVWEDPKVQAEVNDLIDKISKGSTYVSMECLFRDFAFLLTNAATQEQKIIQRTPETAGLTKYLRQYKGSGKIYNYSLARVLKNITFSAVGIVDKPANPDSIISASLDLFNTNAAEGEINSVYINLDSNNMENTMADINVEGDKLSALQAEFNTLAQTHELTIKELDVVNKALAASKEEFTKMADEVKKEKAEDDTDTEMASLKTSIAKLEKKVEDLEKDKASLATANEAMDKTLEEFRKASRHSDRAEAMLKVDTTLSRESALQAVAKFDELSEAGFAGMLEMMKGYASKAPKEVTAEAIISGAKAETDAPMGAVAETKFNKVTADIKNFIKTEKKGS